MANDIQKSESSAVAPAPLTLASYLEQRRAALAQVVPKHLTVDRLLKVALNSVSKSDKLKACSMASILQCVVTCAELGLEPGGALGGAYLVPYKGVATLIIGYRGYVDLMRRSGMISTIKAIVVHQNDRFSYSEGIDTELNHAPTIEGDPGKLRFVYCVIKLKDGGIQVAVMSKAEIDVICNEALRKAFKPEESPWTKHYEEMAKKTVIRRAAKLAPMSSEIAKAMEAEDEDDFIDGEVVTQGGSGISHLTSGEAITAPPRPKLVTMPEFPQEAEVVKDDLTGPLAESVAQAQQPKPTPPAPNPSPPSMAAAFLSTEEGVNAAIDNAKARPELNNLASAIGKFEGEAKSRLTARYAAKMKEISK
jgi:phage RecT family recombinase